MAGLGQDVLEKFTSDLSYLTSEEERKQLLDSYKYELSKVADREELPELYRQLDTSVASWQQQQADTSLQRNVEHFGKRLVGADDRISDQHWGGQVAGDLARNALIFGAGGLLAAPTGGASLVAAPLLAGLLSARQSVNEDASAMQLTEGEQLQRILQGDIASGGKALAMGALDAVPGLGVAGKLGKAGARTKGLGALAAALGETGGLTDDALRAASKTAGGQFRRGAMNEMLLDAGTNVVQGGLDRSLDREYGGGFNQQTQGLDLGAMAMDAAVGGVLPTAIDLGTKGANALSSRFLGRNLPFYSAPQTAKGLEDEITGIGQRLRLLDDPEARARTRVGEQARAELALQEQDILTKLRAADQVGDRQAVVAYTDQLVQLREQGARLDATLGQDKQVLQARIAQQRDALDNVDTRFDQTVADYQTVNREDQAYMGAVNRYRDAQAQASQEQAALLRAKAEQDAYLRQQYGDASGELVGQSPYARIGDDGLLPAADPASKQGSYLRGQRQEDNIQALLQEQLALRARLDAEAMGETPLPLLGKQDVAPAGGETIYAGPEQRPRFLDDPTDELQATNLREGGDYDTSDVLDLDYRLASSDPPLLDAAPRADVPLLGGQQTRLLTGTFPTQDIQPDIYGLSNVADGRGQMLLASPEILKLLGEAPVLRGDKARITNTYQKAVSQIDEAYADLEAEIERIAGVPTLTTKNRRRDAELRIAADQKNTLISTLEQLNTKRAELVERMNANIVTNGDARERALISAEIQKIKELKDKIGGLQSQFAKGITLKTNRLYSGVPIPFDVQMDELAANVRIKKLLTDPKVEYATNSSIKPDTSFNYTGTYERAERAAQTLFRMASQNAETIDQHLTNINPKLNFNFKGSVEDAQAVHSTLAYMIRRSVDSLPVDLQSTFYTKYMDRIGKIRTEFHDNFEASMLAAQKKGVSREDNANITRLFQTHSLKDIAEGRVDFSSYNLDKFTDELRTLAKAKDYYPDQFKLEKLDKFWLQKNEYTPKLQVYNPITRKYEVMETRLSRTQTSDKELDENYFLKAYKYYNTMLSQNTAKPLMLKQASDSQGRILPIRPDGTIDRTGAVGQIKYKYALDPEGLYAQLQMEHNRTVAEFGNAHPKVKTLEFMMNQIDGKGEFDQADVMNRMARSWRNAMTEAVMSWNISSVFRSIPDMFLTGINEKNAMYAMGELFTNAEQSAKRLSRLGIASQYASIVQTGSGAENFSIKNRPNPQMFLENKLRQLTTNALAHKYSQEYNIDPDDIFTKDTPLARELRGQIRRQLSDTMGTINPLQKRPLIYKNVLGFAGGFLTDSSIQEKQVLMSMVGDFAKKPNREQGMALLRYVTMKGLMGGSSAVVDPKTMAFIVSIASAVPALAPVAAQVSALYDQTNGGALKDAYAALGQEPVVNPILDVPIIFDAFHSGMDVAKMLPAAIEDAVQGDTSKLQTFLTTGTAGTFVGTGGYAVLDYLTSRVGLGGLPLTGAPMAFRAAREFGRLATNGGVYEYNKEPMVQTLPNAVSNTLFGGGDAQEQATKRAQSTIRVLANAAGALGATEEDLSFAMADPGFEALVDQYTQRYGFKFDPSMSDEQRREFVYAEVKEKLKSSDDEQSLKRSVKKLMRLREEVEMSGNMGQVQAVEQAIQNALLKLQDRYAEDPMDVLQSAQSGYEDEYSNYTEDAA